MLTLLDFDVVDRGWRAARDGLRFKRCSAPSVLSVDLFRSGWDEVIEGRMIHATDLDDTPDAIAGEHPLQRLVDYVKAIVAAYSRHHDNFTSNRARMRDGVRMISPALPGMELGRFAFRWAAVLRLRFAAMMIRAIAAWFGSRMRKGGLGRCTRSFRLRTVPTALSNWGKGERPASRSGQTRGTESELQPSVNEATKANIRLGTKPSRLVACSSMRLLPAGLIHRFARNATNVKNLPRVLATCSILATQRD